MGLTPLDEVRAHVQGRVGRVAAAPEHEVDLHGAMGLALARDVVAPVSVPPFANSGMDGFAVRAADCATATPDAPVELKIVGEVAAGAVADTPLGAGEAIRIMTGAPVPPGADAIVIVEHTETRGDAVVVREPAGAHIRPAGGDIALDDLVFRAGTEVGPAHVGVLATLGIAHVPIRALRAAVVSTGDELVAPGEPLPAGKIYESNGAMLDALLRRAGAASVTREVAPDDEASLTHRLEAAVAHHHVVVTSGGVSMGDYDYVKVVLDRIAETTWFQVAIRPAKPFTFGVATAPDGREVPIFGLPGNPVSSFVSFELFVRPALRLLMGFSEIDRPVVRAVAAAEMRRRPDGKTHLDRVRVRHDGGRLVAERSGAQASNVLSAMALANGLAMIPDGEGVGVGDELDVMLLDSPPSLGP